MARTPGVTGKATRGIRGRSAVAGKAAGKFQGRWLKLIIRHMPVAAGGFRVPGLVVRSALEVTRGGFVRVPRSA